MKKSLIALAVLAASGAAMAQSSVTLYGIVDANVGQQKTTVKGNTTTDTGEFGGGKTGLSESRWGLRGSEDLGGGLKANFNVEQRFDSSNGTLIGAQFKGKSVVGLSGGFGAVDLGREYTPIYNVLSAHDVDAQSDHTTVNLKSSANDGDRRNRSVTYTSPNFSGFTLKAQVGYNNTKTETTGKPDVETKDRGYGLSAGYANGPLSAAFAYDEQKGATIGSGAAAVFSNDAKVRVWALAGSYDFGAAKLFANYTDAKASNDATVKVGSASEKNGKTTEFNVGVRVPFGVVELVAGVGRNKLENAAGTSQSGTDYNLGVDYNLSKRTKAYVRASQKNKLGGAYDQKTTGFAVGVRHAF